MNEYLTKFANHSAYQAAESSLLKPNVSYCAQENEVHYNSYVDYSNEYLTFVALEDGTFQLSRNTVSYSLDDGQTWTELTKNTASPTVTAGNKIMWKGELTPYSTAGVGTFTATGNFNVQGNPMSLLFGDNFKGQTDLTGKDYAFCHLFANQNAKVINAKNLSLPATILANSCYKEMFWSCTNLITAPELPATTLANNCYETMFWGCTSLITAPILPATILVNKCYNNMFGDCTNLNYIKAMFTTTPSYDYTAAWVSGISSTGTFVKNSAATWDVTGSNGVPSGWTIQTASE